MANGLTASQQAVFDAIKASYPSMSDADIIGMVAPGQSLIDSVYGPGYSTQPLYHEAFPGYDGTLQSAIQYSDAQMSANKRAGLDLLGAALAGGVGGGILSQAGAAAGLASGDAGGATGGAGGGSVFGGAPGGATIAPYPQVGAGAITGTPIDVAGNAIGPAASFGTSSIPYDAALGASSLPGAYGPASTASTAAPGSSSSLSPTGMPTGDVGGGMGLGSPDLAGQVGPGIGAASNVASNLPSWLQNLGSYAPLIGAGAGLLDSLIQPDHTTATQGGTSQSTNTSSLQLPSQLTGAAGTALDRANQLLTTGQQFAPLPYVINHAADQVNNLGTNNAPLTSSFASGANINPYLDMTFNAAADATQNRTASEFANAGQYGSPQNIEARRQELEQLAAGIYGPGYQNAQNLQYGAQEAGVSRGLQQQDSNLNRTLQAAQVALPLGQYMQQQQQQQLDAPYSNLNQYIDQVGALSPYFPGTTQQSQATTQTGQVTQPLYNNPVSSVLGGAVMGSYFGNLFSPKPTTGGMQAPQNMTIQPFGGYNQYPY